MLLTPKLSKVWIVGRWAADFHGFHMALNIVALHLLSDWGISMSKGTNRPAQAPFLDFNHPLSVPDAPLDNYYR